MRQLNLQFVNSSMHGPHDIIDPRNRRVISHGVDKALKCDPLCLFRMLKVVPADRACQTLITLKEASLDLASKIFLVLVIVKNDMLSVHVWVWSWGVHLVDKDQCTTGHGLPEPEISLPEGGVAGDNNPSLPVVFQVVATDHLALSVVDFPHG